MRREMDLIRELMLKLESLDVRPGSTVSFFPGDPKIAIEGRAREQIDAHLFMIGDEDFFQGSANGDIRMLSGQWMFSRLTPKGHDFIDSVRDPEVWKKTKGAAGAAGGWTLGLVVEVGKAVIKETIKEHLKKVGIPMA